MQTSTRSTYSSRRSVATVALLGLAGTLGSVGFGANAASADDSIVIVAPPAPIVATQNDPAAVAEKTVPASEFKIQVIRAKGAAAIAKRQASLAVGQAKLAKESADTPDCGFDAARGSEMTATSTGLTAHGALLAATTELSAAKILYSEIFTNFRVYLVVLPKTGLAIRCDNLLDSIAKFNISAAKVQAAIDAAIAKGGADVTKAQTLKQAAVTTVAGLKPADAIAPCMGLVPDKGLPALQVSNAAALAACDASLDTVRASLKSARSQLSEARDSLKDAKSANHEADKTKREAAKDARKADREAAKDARKGARDAAKDARKAARQAGKADKKS